MYMYMVCVCAVLWPPLSLAVLRCQIIFYLPSMCPQKVPQVLSGISEYGCSCFGSRGSIEGNCAWCSMSGHGSDAPLLVASEISDDEQIDDELLSTGRRGKVGGRQKGKRDMVMQTQK